MNDAPGAPAHAASPGPSRGVSRRAVLLGGAAVVVAAGGGLAVGALRPVAADDEGTGRPPGDLVAARDAEQVLIAAIDATTGGSALVRTALRQVRADHLAHQIALQAALDSYPQSPAGPSPSTSAPAEALDVAGLLSAESAASAQAAARAARLSGPSATLLASIAACEASHAELFR
jgi:hypothetical protein